jgi:PAS domain S-box-containing protein
MDFNRQFLETIEARFLTLSDERLRLEQGLRETEERLRLAQISAEAGVWDLDLRTREVKWSAELEMLYGVAPGSVRRNEHWQHLVHPDDLGRVKTARNAAIRQRQPCHVDYRIIRPSGEVRWVESKSRIFYGEGGEPTRVLGVDIDITERKSAEEACARLAAIVTSSEDAIVSTHDRKIASWNRAAEKLFGWLQEEVIGQPVAVIVPPERLQESQAISAKVKRGDAVTQFDTVRMRKDGSLVDVALTLSPVVLNGRLIAVSAIFRDITQTKRAGEVLRRSEQEFRATFELSGVGRTQVDAATGRFVRVNDKFCELLGYAREELLRLSFLDVTDAEDRLSSSEVVDRLAGGEIPYATFEKRYRRKNGQAIWCLVTASLIRDHRGAAVLVMTDVQDITERKRAEFELRNADRRKDEFIATLAHELRNPLAPLRNAVEMLSASDSTDPEIAWGRKVIDQQVEHLSRLVDDLLDVSRITRNKLELRKERVALGEILNKAVSATRPIINQYWHQLSVALPSEPIYLSADPVRLIQVFGNLLSNAAKYTMQGGRIRVSAEKKDSIVTVRVSDNGIGFSSDQLSHLFDMFYQADRSYQQAQGGLGIGLTLIKQLVEMHGGTVQARSDGPSRGSEFIVCLPISREPVAALAKPSPVDPCPETPRRILVVDDYPNAAESLARWLRRSGHQVRTALDGLQAIETAQTMRPEIVLLDIGMPKLNGYDAARKIRSYDWGKDIVLIALTGWAQEEDRRRTREAGFDGHLVKPVNYGQLTELLGNLAMAPAAAEAVQDD